MSIPVSDEALETYKQMRRSEMFPTIEENRVARKIEAKMREFQTGATRHTDEGKLDYEGFLDPVVLQMFAEYMQQNRIQADGQIRSSDNWQKGIPPEAYMKSLLRHVWDVWKAHRDWVREPETVSRIDIRQALCGVLFNAMGYLHELGPVKQEQLPREEIQNGVYQPRWADSPEAHPVL